MTQAALLSEIAEIERSSVTPDQITDGETYVGLENLTNDGSFVGVAGVAAGQLKSNKFRFDRGHVLYGKLRPYLAKISAPDFAGVCSTDILPIRPGPNVHRRYLLHYLRTPDMIAHASKLAVGINLPRLSPTSLAAFQVPLPPIEEQQRIAAVLDAADALRAKRRQALAKLDTLTQAIFLDGLSRLGPAVALGDRLSFLTSGARGWAKHYVGAGSRFVRSLDVQMNAIGDSDLAFVDAPTTAEARRIRVSGGDVLLTITGSRIGRAAEAPARLDGSYVSQHVAIIRAKPSDLVPAYLSMWLAHPGCGQRQIASKQYGQTKPGLNFEQIRSFQLPIPSLEDQLSLMKTVDAVRNVQIGAELHLTQLDDLFASLQQRAFRGEL